MYPFLVLMVGFLINSTFNVPIGNIICASKKPSYNTIINLISLCCNAVLNYVLIKYIGYIGAAVTTTCITIISSIFSFIFLKKILKSNRRKLNNE